MTTRFNNTLSDIKRQLNLILLDSTFADKVEPYEKISTMITFPEDIDLIKSNVQRVFKFNITQDIADMTPTELLSMIHAARPDFKLLDTKANFTQPTRTPENRNNTGDTTKWSRDLIFSYIIEHISRAMNRSVQSTERIADLMSEASMSGDDLSELNCALRQLEKFFDIKIDQSMKIYNVGNVAESSFIAQGRAPEPKSKDKTKDPIWSAVMVATPKKYLASILERTFNIHLSLRALESVESYEELKAIIQEKQTRKQK